MQVNFVEYSDWMIGQCDNDKNILQIIIYSLKRYLSNKSTEKTYKEILFSSQ